MLWSNENMTTVIGVCFSPSQEPYTVGYVPDQYKTQEICNEAMARHPCMLRHIPDNLKTQEMYIWAVEKNQWANLNYVPDRLKTQRKAVREVVFSLQFVPDWFITQQEIGPWDDNEITEWYEGYKRRKA